MSTLQLLFYLYIYQETLTAAALLILLVVSFSLFVVAVVRNLEIKRIINEGE